MWQSQSPPPGLCLSLAGRFAADGQRYGCNHAGARSVGAVPPVIIVVYVRAANARTAHQTEQGLFRPEVIGMRKDQIVARRQTRETVTAIDIRLHRVDEAV